VGRQRRQPASLHLNPAAPEGAVTHPSKGGLEAPGDGHIQHRRLKDPVTGGGPGSGGCIDQGDGGRKGHHQHIALTFQRACPHPASLEVVQGRTHRCNGPWGAGMATDEPPGLGLVPPPRPHHPAKGPTHEHGGTRTEQGQARHGQTDAVCPGAGVESLGEGTEQGTVGGAEQPLRAANGHHPVFADGPGQQQVSAADVFQAKGGVQVPPGEQGGDVASRIQLHRPSSQPLGQHPPPSFGQDQIRPGSRGQGRDSIQLGIPQADRRIGGPQGEMEADVAGEFGRGRHHHVCLRIGLCQAHILNPTAELSGQTDAEQALSLAALELRLRAAGKIRQIHGQRKGWGAAGQGGLR